MDEKQRIKDNIDLVRQRVRAAEGLSPRGGGVKILLATKTVDADRIEFAVRECGIELIGENRVQELLEKYDRLKELPCKLHFIGTLQKNKVKYIVDKVDCIESVDSLSLAQEIDKRCAQMGRVMDILAEVNIGQEPEKGGVMPQDFAEFCLELKKFRNLRLCGMMTMAPKCSCDAEYEKFFTKTYRLYIDFCEKIADNKKEPPVLSMGMSDSYEAAVRSGSGLIRVGSAVFGKRV